MWKWLKNILKEEEEVFEPWLCQKCGIREVVIACPDHCQECEDDWEKRRKKNSH